MPNSQFLGSWKLVSWKIPGEDGSPHFPLGKKAKGLIVYAPDGYMFAALMAPDRTKFAGDDPLTASAYEAMSAMRGYHTYCGRYRVFDDHVVHTVEMALSPNMIGSEQIRYYRFDGDLLILTTPPLTRAGVTGVAELVWRKVASKSSD
jgi:Lipocalin-like domain